MNNTTHKETEAPTPPPTRALQRLIWVGLGLAAALMLLTLLVAVLKLKAARSSSFPVYGQVADFALTNQDGRTISLADLRGHVWVADIIFTRCAGPCLKMSRQMKELQQGLPPESQAKLISLTTDPDFDTPPVLKTYAKRFDADPNRWQFLTGTKQQIGRLATDSLKLTAIAKDPGERESSEDLFIHSTIFVVVDKHGQLRGVFQTTGEGLDPQQVKPQILAAVDRLEHEQ